jgi:hypothetical protein
MGWCRFIGDYNGMVWTAGKSKKLDQQSVPYGTVVVDEGVGTDAVGLLTGAFWDIEG